MIISILILLVIFSKTIKTPKIKKFSVESDIKMNKYENSYYLTYYRDANKTDAYNNLSGGIVSYENLTSSQINNVTFTDTSFYLGSDLSLKNYAGGYISIPFQIRLPIVWNTTNNTVQTDSAYCERYDCSATQSGTGYCQRYQCTKYVQTSTNTISDRERLEPQLIVIPIIYYSDETGTHWLTCDIDNTDNTIKCPINNKMNNIVRLRISSYVFYTTSASYQYTLNVGKMVKIYSEPTNEIIEQQKETNETLKEEHTYNTNESQSTQQQQQEMNNYEQEEDTLRNNLKLDIEDAEISINPQASTFIWEVVNRLRSINPKIVLLFTSILSLGIMKMVLGR